jgi:RecJ-like exonuclease
MCKRCGGSGSNHNQIKPGACPICLGNGYVDMEMVVKGYKKLIKHHEKYIDEYQSAIDTIRQE